jgi:predicted nucleotidyltransferase component of viral defense system
VAANVILSRDQLRRMAARRHLSLGVLEKEYVLELVLRSICEQEELRRVLVLKGGAALYRFYVGARLSLDLDFTAIRPVTLDEVRPALELSELQAVVAEHQVFRDALTIKRLRYVGPLSYPNSIKVDLSFREPVLLPPLDLRAESPYGESFVARVMQPAEIAAEKLRALVTRQVPRDVYDLWVLAVRQLADVQQIAELVPRKLAAVRVVMNPETAMQHLAAVEPVWHSDLGALMATVPDFVQVQSVLIPWLDDLFSRMSNK